MTIINYYYYLAGCPLGPSSGLHPHTPTPGVQLEGWDRPSDPHPGLVVCSRTPFPGLCPCPHPNRATGSGRGWRDAAGASLQPHVLLGHGYYMLVFIFPAGRGCSRGERN